MIHILYDGDILLRAMFATKLPPHVAVQTMLKIKDREIREARRYYKEFNRVDPKFYFCISLNRGFRTVLFAYYTNKIFVFRSKGKSFKEFVSFVGSRVITLLLDTALMLLFVKVINMNDLIAKVIVQIVVIVGNYIISKMIVFKKRVK